MVDALRKRIVGDTREMESRLDRMQADLRDLERALRDVRQEVAKLQAGPPTPSYADAARALATPAPAAAAGPTKPASTAGTARVDEKECIGCATCVDLAPTVFRMAANAKAVVTGQAGPADKIQAAADACPVSCIHVE